MPFRAPLIVVAALAASLLAPRTAAAALKFAPCGKAAVECGTVLVPLDRTGGTPGTISLYVERLRGGGTPRGVMFLIAGGPGQASASAFDLEGSGAFFRDQFPGYTLVAFDPRGTGRSGVLRCPELQSDPAASPARLRALVATCANEIGPNRRFYSTRDHADDIDSVREALGVDKAALWGTSYGTQLSMAYALIHPTHVERLLLDSVADVAGRDPFSRDDLQQMPKGLASLCGGGLCRAATSNFVGEVAKLANRLAARPVTGKVPRAGGGTVSVRVDGVDFLSGVVLDSDLNAGLAAELPAAVHAALSGRPRALLRLVQLDRASSIIPAEDLSMGLLAATVCDDGPFPWAPDTPVAQRRARPGRLLPPVAGAAGAPGRRFRAAPERAGPRRRGRARPADTGVERSGCRRTVPAGAAPDRARCRAQRPRSRLLRVCRGCRADVARRQCPALALPAVADAREPDCGAPGVGRRVAAGRRSRPAWADAYRRRADRS
jgi:pimeloyl-ACP methyl ester carboxylesterase